MTTLTRRSLLAKSPAVLAAGALALFAPAILKPAKANAAVAYNEYGEPLHTGPARPADVPVAYAGVCDCHMGHWDYAWTIAGAREQMARDARQAWLKEAPAEYLRLLNDLADELLRRTGGVEPSEAQLDALCVPMAAWMGQRIVQLTPEHPRVTAMDADEAPRLARARAGNGPQQLGTRRSNVFGGHNRRVASPFLRSSGV